MLVATLNPIWVKIADFGVSKRTKGTVLRTQVVTPGYVAPEVLGLLPRMAMRNTYSNAVDLWALGCVVHELLTRVVPFVEVSCTESMMSGLTLDSDFEIDQTPQTDMKALSSFCDGTSELPCASLRQSCASETAIAFLKTVLIADPQSRVTAENALHCAWLMEQGDSAMSIGQVRSSIERMAVVPTAATEIYEPPEGAVRHATDEGSSDDQSAKTITARKVREPAKRPFPYATRTATAPKVNMSLEKPIPRASAKDIAPISRGVVSLWVDATSAAGAPGNRRRRPKVDK